MRTWLGLIVLLVANTAIAQQQERKLIDRLLKPDTTLVSPNQNKQFAFRGTTTTKTMRSKSFFIFARRGEKQYNTPAVSPKAYGTNAVTDATRAASVSSRSSFVASGQQYSVPDYTPTPSVRDGSRTVDTSAYDGTRSFLVRGKSQKSLSTQDKPMTIDEVRELLNKNK